MQLHGREVSYELCGNFIKMSQHLHGTSDHARLMIVEAMVLAEGSYKSVHSLQVVTWQSRKQMVINLVLQTTAKPINEPIGSNIARGRYLQRPEVRSLIRGIHRHPVMAKAEDDCQHKSTEGLRQQQEADGM